MIKELDPEFQNKKKLALSMLKDGKTPLEISKELGLKTYHISRWKNSEDKTNLVHSEGKKKLISSILKTSTVEETSEISGIPKGTVKNWERETRDPVLEPKRGVYQGTKIHIPKSELGKYKELAIIAKSRSGITSKEWLVLNRPNTSELRKRAIERMLMRGLESSDIKITLDLFKNLPKVFIESPDDFVSVIGDPICYPSKRIDSH